LLPKGCYHNEVMKEANPSDIYEVRPLSLFTSLDEKVVVDLYEPLIGAKAVAVFFSLLAEEPGVISKHADLYAKTQLAPGEWLAAVTALEAVSLVETYRGSADHYAYYCYCLYAPKSPKDFFDNALFAGTLQKYLGAEKCDALSKKYAIGFEAPKDFEDISESFVDFFAPDFSDPSYAAGLRSSGAQRTLEAKVGFDRNVFLKRLLEKDPRFTPYSLTKEEMLKVERLSGLYSYEEGTMADLVSDHYVFQKNAGKRLDYAGLSKDCADSIKLGYQKIQAPRKSEIHGDSSWANSIRSMESLTPVEFLTGLQKGNKPAKSDLLLLNELTVEMGLSAPVCNALIFYVLTKNDNVLSARLAEKIAGSLVREGIVTAIDAMNYFTRTSKKSSPKPVEKVIEAPKEVVKEEAPADTMSDEEFKKMMDGIGKRKKQG
jgi:replication initiation and membrane attachment protein